MTELFNQHPFLTFILAVAVLGFVGNVLGDLLLEWKASRQHKREMQIQEAKLLRDTLIANDPLASQIESLEHQPGQTVNTSAEVKQEHEA